MRGYVCALAGVLAAIAAPVAFAAAFPAVHGVIHDADHRPLAGARIVITGSSLTQPVALVSDAAGEFTTDLSPGAYTVAITAQGFAPETRRIEVSPGKNPVLHLQLEVAALNQAVDVTGQTSSLKTETSTVQTSVSAKEIEQTPGADQTNSLAMITDFTPGAYMVHDMLHMRGGHQVNWFFDGIPLINTNIATNIAPLVNPKDVADLQTERGGYSSEYGDRTYGFFNVITPSGFDRDNEADIIGSAGSFGSTDDQFNIGGHTERFAYYASADGNRSDLGLMTPVPQTIHDSTFGEGGFVSLLFNPNANNQFRWVFSARGSNYDVPNTQDQQAAGIADQQLERDVLVGFNWEHSFTSGVTFVLTPYFHFNRADFAGGPNDTPFVLNDNVRSDYMGGRSVLQIQKGRHNATAGLEVWAQDDNNFFGLTNNPGGAVLNQTEVHWATSTSAFADDQWKLTKWVTLDLGLRFTHYAGLVNENATDPRLGGAVRIPRLNWILRGYYAYYYQPPPLDSLQGPALDFAVAQGYGFVPLQGERDIQHDIGFTIPVAGWALEADNFHTSAKNFLDHDVIGNSGIFIPLTDLGALISGTEVTVRSPRLAHVAQLRVAYSNQIAQGIGPITGGLLESEPPGNFLLDHDQRNTVSGVLSLNLPDRAWATTTYEFGSGFLNGDGPAHLPPHSTFDLSLGKRFGEAWTASVNATNIGNERYLLDTSNTFGGTHWIYPRQVYGEVRYRFHF